MAAPAKCFRGDSEAHLNLLIKVCNEQRPSPEAYAERELQPFDFSEAPPLPSSVVKGRPHAAHRTPNQSPPKKKQAGSPKACSQADGVNNSKKISSRKSFESNERNLMLKTASPARFASLDGAGDLARVLATRPSAGSPGACPGFFSSPRPCEIPMPTGLLMRALVKA